MPVVLVNMTIHTNGHMTISDAMKHFGVSEKTIRRWIQQGKIEAEKVDGRWQIFNDLTSDRTSGQNDQTPDPTSDQTSDLRSEIQHLRDQLARRDDQIDALTHAIDQNQKLLAMQTQNNAQLSRQLDPPQKPPSGLKRVFRWT